MEKPSVIFSEQGWRDFLAFISGTEQSEERSNSVDKFVEEYHKQKKTSSRLSDMDDHIQELLQSANRPIKASVIREHLAFLGYDINTKSFTTTMNGVMKRRPVIERVERGYYAYTGVDNE